MNKDKIKQARDDLDSFSTPHDDLRSLIDEVRDVLSAVLAGEEKITHHQSLYRRYLLRGELVAYPSVRVFRSNPWHAPPAREHVMLPDSVLKQSMVVLLFELATLEEKSVTRLVLSACADTCWIVGRLVVLRSGEDEQYAAS